MLRITVENRGAALHWRVEGRLTGAWVSELEQCWRRFRARSPSASLVVDLSDTEFVDSAGRYLLALMYQSGVQLTATSLYMEPMVAEIVANARTVGHGSGHGGRGNTSCTENK